MTSKRISSWVKRPDQLSVLVLFVVVLFVRVRTLDPNLLSWDVFGYYLYLPATFIHQDLLLSDISWVEQVQAQYKTTGSLYQITTVEGGARAYTLLMGTALLYAPFFLVGHGAAWVMGYPMDGFSMPYQTSVALGCSLYTLLSLLILRRILRRFFSERLTAVVLIILVLGSNYFHQVTQKNLETANFLVFLLAALTWCTLRWYEEGKRVHVLVIGAALGLLTLVKPSEATFGLLPVLWGLHSWDSMRERWRYAARHSGDIVLAAAVCLAVLSPQLFLWRSMTGAWLPYTYHNPGVGLDWTDPHLGPVLFSFRKGWLIYTPVMLFALLGFIPLWRHQRKLFWTILVSFLVSYYVIACWTEWWHGGGFSIRPFITDYVILSIPLGLMLRSLWNSSLLVKATGAVLVSGLVVLNLFQTWQHFHFVLDPYRNTRAYYFKVFGRTRVPESADTLLLVDRVFDNTEHALPRSRYWERPLALFDVADAGSTTGHSVIDSVLGRTVLRMDSTYDYSLAVDLPYRNITGTDHFWARASAKIKIPENYHEALPCLVMEMRREEGPYWYKAVCLSDTATRGSWTKFHHDYLTPELRSTKDRFRAYLWHRGKDPILVDDLRITVYTPQCEF